MPKIKVRNNHDSSVSRVGYTFQPKEITGPIEVSDYNLFKISVVRYLDVTVIEENKEEDSGNNDQTDQKVESDSVDSEIDGLNLKKLDEENSKPELEVMLDNLSVNQLQQLAKELEMSGYSQLNKGPLIDEIIEDNEANKIREIAPEVFPKE
ncbi:Rho termination factor N-terminal domain-containing protein [Sporohalobacter salinus]|uniref:Rho termination factor N-terminal domain-containing protein n=1 Tax=Sporohalobacter salinus TaxID=1494606 RepID=UPI00195FA593|nr:Rho termination factor N-terminal domain-containing protein [Sporohalobacter salinus]MBM7623723.1 hypothetical protein [Sporohalobacter salinus]